MMSMPNPNSQAGCPVDHSAAAHTSLQDLPTPKGTNGLPLVGDTLEFLVNPVRFRERREAKFGEVFYSNILGARTINVAGSVGHQWVFTGENHYLKNQWTSAIRQLLGSRSISMIEGSEHRARRQMHAASFSYDAMSDFIPTINQIVARTFNEWATRGTPIEVVSAMRALTFEIATVFVFGDAESVDLTRLMHEFHQVAAGMFGLAIKSRFTTFGKSLRAKERMYAILRQAMADRRKTGEPGKGVLGNLLSVRDSAGAPLPDEVIIHELHVILFAGHETTITANTYLMMFLAQNPDILAKAREEQATFEESALLDSAALKSMAYGECIINETLRYFPPVGGMFRIMTQDTEYKGFRIPAGYAISITPSITHFDPAIWTEPAKFDPSRFERSEHKKQPFTFIPFGGGPRLCLGQNFAMSELRIILAQLARHFQWDLLPNQDLTPRLFPSPTPKKGMYIHFKQTSTSPSVPLR